MRSSDWSSDVCSSDVVTVNAGNIHYRRRFMAILTKRQKMGLLLMAAAVAAAMVIWTWGEGDEAAATDTAYIRGDMTSLAPKVAGYVMAVEANDNLVVKIGRAHV